MVAVQQTKKGSALKRLTLIAKPHGPRSQRPGQRPHEVSSLHVNQCSFHKSPVLPAAVCPIRIRETQHLSDAQPAFEVIIRSSVFCTNCTLNNLSLNTKARKLVEIQTDHKRGPFFTSKAMCPRFKLRPNGHKQRSRQSLSTAVDSQNSKFQSNGSLFRAYSKARRSLLT
jgi:hypothetical protein